MVAAAAESGRHLMVDFHARWHPLFMGAKSYVDRGNLGAPVMAYARLSDTISVPTEMLEWSGQSGPEWFLFPHTMDVVRWLFGREPVEVTAKGYRGVLERRGIACWDAIQAIVEFEGGAFCTFETSWIVPDSYSNVVDNRLSIYGEKGGLEIRNEPSLWAFTDRFHTPFSSESVTRYGKVWGYQYEPIRYFVDCVADGVSPEATGADGLVVTAMIAATLRLSGSPRCSTEMPRARPAWRLREGNLDERHGPVQAGRQASTRDGREPRPRPRHGAGPRGCRGRHRHHRTHGRDARADCR
jgi:predicted dehydrogenase